MGSCTCHSVARGGKQTTAVAAWAVVEAKTLERFPIYSQCVPEPWVGFPLLICALFWGTKNTKKSISTSPLRTMLCTEATIAKRFSFDFLCSIYRQVLCHWCQNAKRLISIFCSSNIRGMWKNWISFLKHIFLHALFSPRKTELCFRTLKWAYSWANCEWRKFVWY